MPKTTSKTAEIRKLLKRPKGASISQLQAATQWQAHSIRAALTRLRQSGVPLERLPTGKAGGSRYRISGQASSASS